jgi:hypothetical protein
MEKNYFNQDTIDWLAKRCGRFTASEIHKLFVGGRKKDELFGQGAMTYIRTKAAELLTMEVKEEVNFKQAEWGKANETDGVRALEEYLGINGIHYGIVNPEFFNYGDYAGGSPDWESLDQVDGADIKCPFDSGEHVKNLMILSAEELKAERWEYYCQGQMNMRIRGWEKFHFVSYDPRMVEPALRLKVITIYPDAEWTREFSYRLTEAISLVKSIVSALQTKPVEA